MDCLLAAGADIRTLGPGLVKIAADSGSTETLQCLIAAGADRKGLLRGLAGYPPAVQKLVVSTGKPLRISVEKYAHHGVCPEAIYVLLDRQGKTDLTAMLRATQMLEPLEPAARADLLADLLSQEKQPETARATP